MMASENKDTDPTEQRNREHELALHELHHASLVFWVDGAGLGDAHAQKIATVLGAITAHLSGLGDGRTLDELYRSAVGYFERVGNTTSPFAMNSAAGADELCGLLENWRFRGAQTEEMAIQALNAVHRCRPGLPGLRPYYAAQSEDEQRSAAVALREQLTKALDKVSRSAIASDVDAWAESATRAVLRALGDPHADNALKHRMKK